VVQNACCTFTHIIAMEIWIVWIAPLVSVDDEIH